MKQCVMLDGVTSSATDVTLGVPQCLIVGLLLFLLSVNALAELHTSNSASICLYVDDIIY